MGNTSKTDWKRLASMKDEDIDLSDIPELDEAFFERAERRMPPKQVVPLSLDADIVKWFEGEVPDHEGKINQLLREYMKANRKNPE
jgi:uncharacterized protein (DUF4415 family)